MIKKKFIMAFNQAFSDYGVLTFPVNTYTIKLIFQNIIPGEVVKFEFGNEFDDQPLNVMSAKVNYCDDESSATAITFNQKQKFQIQSGTNLWSDNIFLENREGSPLYVYLKLSNKDNILKSSANLFNDTRLNIEYFPEFTHEFLNSDIQLLVGIKSVAVVTPKFYTTISFFGDSLTNHAYFANPFIDYLNSENFTVIGLNAGISGNKLLSSGEESISKWKFSFGSAGIRRFEKDVLQTQPDIIVSLIGVNDLFHPGTNEAASRLPTALDLIDGIKQLMQVSQVRNSLYIPVTLPPFQGALNNEIEAWNEVKETIRQEVNLWIRQQLSYIDLDLFVSDEANKQKLSSQYDGGDHIHFSPSAGEKIGKYMAQKFLEILDSNKQSKKNLNIIDMRKGFED